MGLFTKIITSSAFMTTFAGVFAKAINYKQSKNKILRKIVWFVIIMYLQNVIKLKILKMKIFFKEVGKEFYSLSKKLKPIS